MKRDEAVKINKGQIIKVWPSELGSLNFIHRRVTEGTWAGKRVDLASGKSLYLSKPQVPNMQSKCDNTYLAARWERLNLISCPNSIGQ